MNVMYSLFDDLIIIFEWMPGYLQKEMMILLNVNVPCVFAEQHRPQTAGEARMADWQGSGQAGSRYLLI